MTLQIPVSRGNACRPRNGACYASSMSRQSNPQGKAPTCSCEPQLKRISRVAARGLLQNVKSFLNSKAIFKTCYMNQLCRRNGEAFQLAKHQLACCSMPSSLSSMFLAMLQKRTAGMEALGRITQISKCCSSCGKASMGSLALHCQVRGLAQEYPSKQLRT